MRLHINSESQPSAEVLYKGHALSAVVIVLLFGVPEPMSRSGTALMQQLFTKVLHDLRRCKLKHVRLVLGNPICR